MGENRQAILHTAENLVASAVRLLYFHCGEQLSAAIIAQMAEEQARYISHLQLVHGAPPTETKH